jgi:glyoxylase-like metal-dependent hydrolase (beta-lactamase superfamily II)
MKSILVHVLLLGTAASAIAEPTASSSTLQSFQQARAVLTRAIDVAGGAANIRKLRNVSLSYTGNRNMINQSTRAFPPWNREPSSGAVVVDREGNRIFFENYTTFPGIGRFGGATALKGDKGAHWEPLRNHHGSTLIATYSGRETDGLWAVIPRWVPPLILVDAWESGTNLRSLGKTTRKGVAMHALAWTQRNGVMITLLFDARTGALSGYETIRDDGVYGDVTERVEFSSWRTIGSVAFPSRRVEWFNDEIARELDLSYRIDSALEDRQFEVPPGYTPQEPPPQPGKRLLKVGDGVYLDTEHGGVMIVEFRDFLVVVETPDNYEMSHSTIAAARDAFPNKPIRYAVPSHTHGDHGGGARAYFHAGATLLTTPGHVEFYRRLARVRRTISPDPYVAAERIPSIETFRGKRVITDGNQTMVLYDIGPNAHSEELTIAYLPRQGIVWQADVFLTPSTGGGLNPAMPIGIEFAKKLKALGIDKFQTLLEAHHSRPVTFDEFRRALALGGYRD